MSEEVLIPKMTRINKSKKKIKIPLLNVAIILFCSLLLVGATFINLDIKHYIIPSSIFSNNNLNLEDFIFSFYLIPQIPIVLFITAILGKRMALTSLLIYIIAGLAYLPIFALGGGIKYIFEYGFGYILAYIPAAVIVGNILEKKYSFSKIIKASFLGVLTIHILGILYMCIIALLKHSGANFITGWIYAQSGLKIIYDIIASFLLILIGKYLHSALKFIID